MHWNHDLILLRIWHVLQYVPGDFYVADWQMNASSSTFLNIPSLLTLSCSWVCPDNFPLEGSPVPAIHKASANLLSVSQAREELLTSAKKKKGHIYLDLVGLDKKTHSFTCWRSYYTDSHFYSHYNICQPSNHNGFKKIYNPKNPCYHGYRIMKQEENS